MKSEFVPLLFDADQDQYEAWYEATMARVNDPDDDLLFVDLNDGVLVFAAARRLGLKHFDRVDLLREHTPEAVERAMTEAGLFMGVTWLANQVEIDPHEAREEVLAVLGGG